MQAVYKRIKSLWIILLFVLTSCQSPTEPTTTDGPIVVLDSPIFQIKPNGTFAERINDSLYIVTISDQWQTFESLEAQFSGIYAGAKCSWVADCKTKATYTYMGTVCDAPIINNSSYFSNGKSSTIVSFYKQFVSDTVVVAAAVLSEKTDKIYMDLLYFIVKMKN